MIQIWTNGPLNIQNGEIMKEINEVKMTTNCRYCGRAGYTTKEIQVCTYTEDKPKYDGIFGRVEVGRVQTQRQPLMKIVVGTRSYFTIPMPKKFKFCPMCGRKIGQEKVTNDINGL